VIGCGCGCSAVDFGDPTTNCDTNVPAPVAGVLAVVAAIAAAIAAADGEAMTGGAASLTVSCTTTKSCD
jgi:hypothetical protein